MMVDERDRTRRSVLQLCAATIGAGLLTGCAQEGQQSPTTGDGGDEGGTPTADETETPTAGETGYTVSIEPVGDVEFEEVPKTWAANNGSWADMGIALGLEPPEGVWLPDRYHTRYYDEIDGVEVDASRIRQLWGDSGVGKEQFYAMDADVHVIDPNFLLNRADWSQDDLDEIGGNVGPFFGNSIFSRDYAWHDDYRYYTLYEAFGKLAQVFQREERYEAFETLHEEFQMDLSEIVPSEGDRPAAAVIWGDGDAPEEFYPYVISEGTSFKHLNDLGIRDALANTDVRDFHSNRGAIDYEALLEVDPEVVLIRGQEAKDREAFRDTVVSFMEDHGVASELTAVENSDVYRAGPLYQGPITNLVVTERLARGLYGTDETLFDRDRVAAVVAGDV